MNKKTFIGKFLVFISIGSLIFPANSIAASKPSIQPGLPPAIILFIGDGMGAAQRTAGRWASVGQTGQLNMDRLPVSGWVMTHNAANAITDSAAAPARRGRAAHLHRRLRVPQQPPWPLAKKPSMDISAFRSI